MKKKRKTLLIFALITPLRYLYKTSFFERTENKTQNIFHTPQYDHTHFNKKGKTPYTNYKLITNYNTNTLSKYKHTKILRTHQSIFADILRILTLQEGGQTNKNTNSIAQKLENLTTLSPWRHHPYIFSQRILPIDKENPKYNAIEKQYSRQKTTEIWEKGIVYTCLQSDSTKKCTNFELPQNLAFNYFYYLNNPEKAIKYYKIASAQTWATKNISNMEIIIMGKSWNHAKSANLRFAKAETTTEKTDQLHFLYKAVYEITLDLITQSADTHPECKTNINCLIQNLHLSTTVQKQINKCEQTSQDDNICQILAYALQNNFIEKNWNLNYPPLSEENFIYTRRPDRNDRGIILKEK